MTIHTYQLKEELRERLADIMLEALKTEGGIYPTEKEYYALKEALMEALYGKLRV